MNIFFVDSNPVKAAEVLIDKHVVKMVLESAQLLCTCHRVVDGIHYIDSSSGRRLQRWKHPDSVLDELLYKSQHFNHPCSLWLRESADNYDWLYAHFIALGQEYEKRYGKKHASIVKLADVLRDAPQNLAWNGFTCPAQAMPEEYMNEASSIEAYRSYYINEKLPLGNEQDKIRFLKFIKETE